MNLNWKVRFKNPLFWTTAVPDFFAMVYTWCGLCGFTPSVTESEIVGAVLLVVEFLAMIGILVDPTTAGTSDSKQAMAYSKPKKEE